jgi:AcrR family transcriptional regulator
MSTEQKILEKTKELFFRLGIKSVTMDDIAQELGMSKKTLYKYVDNKSDLVYKVLQNHLLAEEEFIEQLEKLDVNGIDLIVEIIKHVIKSMSNMSLSAIYDLQKYYPESWVLLEDFKSCSILETMENILKKGKKEGLFRKEIKEALVSKFYMISIEGIMNPFNFTAYRKYDFKEIYLEYIIYHLHGIVSDEGHEYLKTIKL